MLKSLEGVYEFRLLTLELLVPENTMLSYLKIIQNVLMTFLAGSLVSDRCPMGYLFFKRQQHGVELTILKGFVEYYLFELVLLYLT